MIVCFGLVPLSFCLALRHDLEIETSGGTTVAVRNLTTVATTVYVTFGGDSVVRPASWKKFCTIDSTLVCHFKLGARAAKALPIGREYMNATFSFGRPLVCGVTKAELNVNNPAWYDITDVSLVDGYSSPISIQVAGIPDASAPLVFGASGKDAVTMTPSVGDTEQEDSYFVLDTWRVRD